MRFTPATVPRLEVKAKTKGLKKIQKKKNKKGKKNK